MNAGPTGKKKGNGQREAVTVTLPAGQVDQLRDFCREYRVTPDQVVERALADYFREGDMSH